MELQSRKPAVIWVDFWKTCLIQLCWVTVPLHLSFFLILSFYPLSSLCLSSFSTLSLCISSPSALCLSISLSFLLRIKVHFAAGEPAGRLRLAEPGTDLVVLPAECQRALGEWAVWTTPPGPLWAPVWPRDRWAKNQTEASINSLLYQDCYHGNLANYFWYEHALSSPARMASVIISMETTVMLGKMYLAYHRMFVT